MSRIATNLFHVRIIGTLAALRPKSKRIVKRVVFDRKTKILQMHPNLVHSAGLWKDAHQRGLAIEADLLEDSLAFLSFRRNVADADLVRHALNRLLHGNFIPVTI